MIYNTPSEFYYRLHHPRPRFKNNVESVLLFVASEISRLERMESEKFKEQLNMAIRRFPGNSSKTDKTINNWRTEISSLFGLIEYEGVYSKPSALCKLLADNEDLPEFFRYFLFRFEYPGFHQKPHVIADIISHEIYFKPAKYILSLLKKGEELTGKRFSVNKAELTHIVFNDLRFTTGSLTVEDAVKIILKNRSNSCDYNWDGDVVRYAGDILDYMEIAGLLICHDNNNFFVNKYEYELTKSFLEDTSKFTEFEGFYNAAEIKSSDVKLLLDDWFTYVNSHIGEEELFKTDIASFIESGIETGSLKNYQRSFVEKLEHDKSLKTKDIGDFGEAIVLDHEKMYLKINGRDDLALKVTHVAHLPLGCDLISWTLDELQKYIEVKTTISRKRLNFNKLHLTTNEWLVAKSNRDKYYIYRLMISQDNISLFIIQDPVGKEREELLEMIPRDGADIKFTEKTGRWEDVLVWEN